MVINGQSFVFGCVCDFLAGNGNEITGTVNKFHRLEGITDFHIGKCKIGIETGGAFKMLQSPVKVELHEVLNSFVEMLFCLSGLRRNPGGFTTTANKKSQTDQQCERQE